MVVVATVTTVMHILLHSMYEHRTCRKIKKVAKDVVALMVK